MVRHKEESGFSLVELLVASALLLITLTPILNMMAGSRKNAEFAARQSEAIALARSTMNDLEAADWDSLLSAPAAPHPLNADFHYTVTVNDRLPGDPNNYIRDIVVEVTWSMGGYQARATLYSARYKPGG